MTPRKGGDGFTPKTGFSFANKNQFTQDGFGRVKAIVNCNGAKWRVPFDLMSVVTE